MVKQRKPLRDKEGPVNTKRYYLFEETRDSKKPAGRLRKGEPHLSGIPSIPALVKPKKLSYLTNKCHAVGISSRGEKVSEKSAKEEEDETCAVIHDECPDPGQNLEVSKETPEGQIPPLRPLYFEVPQEEDQRLVERTWMYEAIEEKFSKESNTRAVVIHGRPGTGKTTIALQLVEHSCFGRKVGAVMKKDSPLVNLASKIVAYHFCQVDNRNVCMVSDFVHSVAAQMCQAPLLSAYRNYLQEHQDVQDTLSSTRCLASPHQAFIHGIIGPLILLRKCRKLMDPYYVLIVDAVDEAESHRPGNGDTIGTFLSKHILKLPPWIKIIITVRSSQLGIVDLLPHRSISLDSMDDRVDEDARQYVSHRFETLLCPNERKRGLKGRVEARIMPGLKTHLLQLSGGCFLFLKLTIDLIEQGHLVVKANGFKVLPISLQEVFQLHCNLRFPNSQIFGSVSPILSTCLAALVPLNLLEIYHSVNSLRFKDNLPWVEFLRVFKTVQGLLVKRMDGSYMFLHSSFRDWLLGKDFCNPKFQCNPEVGHAAIALRLLRVEHPLSPSKILDLTHHLMKAKCFRGNRKESSHLNLALFLLSSAEDISAAFSSLSPISNTKISRLLTAGPEKSSI